MERRFVRQNERVLVSCFRYYSLAQHRCGFLSLRIVEFFSLKPWIWKKQRRGSCLLVLVQVFLVCLDGGDLNWWTWPFVFISPLRLSKTPQAVTAPNLFSHNLSFPVSIRKTVWSEFITPTRGLEQTNMFCWLLFCSRWEKWCGEGFEAYLYLLRHIFLLVPHL